jgi:predicted transcriptional regulator YdeE
MNKLFFIIVGFCMSNGILKAGNGFDVMGITARTSNLAEFYGSGTIGQVWQKFFAEQVLAEIPNKTDNDILALYCDYASDKDGEYTFLLGARVNNVDEIPEGMVVKHVPAGNYEVFTTQPGLLSEVVIQQWQKIWTLEDEDKLNNRTYKVDYEVYDARSQDPENAVVEIYIGVK